MEKISVSKIGLGTWKLGGDVDASFENDDKRDIRAILFAIENGINHIDTSESYSGGKSEELVGAAIKQVDRNKIFLATKVREWNLKYDDLINSCYSSLKRLQTDYIDLYYIHKQNPSISIKETCKALNYLLDIGLIKDVGLSNVGIEKIEEFNKYLNKRIYAVQNQYNLVCRESRYKKVIEYCKNNDIKFICWRPILLSYPGVIDPLYIDGIYPILDDMAKKYKVSKVQIVAKWLVQQDNIYIIFKSNNIKHIEEIIGIDSFKLSDADWKMLDEKFPVQFNKGVTINEFFELS